MHPYGGSSGVLGPPVITRFFKDTWSYAYVFKVLQRMEPEPHLHYFHE